MCYVRFVAVVAIIIIIWLQAHWDHLLDKQSKMHYYYSSSSTHNSSTDSYSKSAYL